MPGHSEDCAACRWDQLPDEDRAALDPAAFSEHTRSEPPDLSAPISDTHGRLAGLATVTIFVTGLCMESAPVVTVGVLCALVTAYMFRGIRDEQAEIDDAWMRQMTQWKTDQTRVWLQSRLVGELWPCPTCGELTCPNQHSVTTTKGVRVGHFYSSKSYTDSS